uniref:Uncharacterized protein n=1 Tax=Pipistrellus kuhlii TaxID=59472 RepID=A0A7J8A845_PIPKU|nr:hypothetical protein mPipKuh1_008801 [Pipistrellus kuhlii]
MTPLFPNPPKATAHQRAGSLHFQPSCSAFPQHPFPPVWAALWNFCWGVRTTTSSWSQPLSPPGQEVGIRSPGLELSPVLCQVPASEMNTPHLASERGSVGTWGLGEKENISYSPRGVSRTPLPWAGWKSSLNDWSASSHHGELVPG